MENPIAIGGDDALDVPTVLRRARDVLEGHWTTGALVKDTDGTPIDNVQEGYAFCALGAVAHVLGLEDWENTAVANRCEAALIDTINAVYRERGWLVTEEDGDCDEDEEFNALYQNARANDEFTEIPEWNDDYALDEAEVLEIFEIAANRAAIAASG